MTDDSECKDGRTLCAILLNPALRSAEVTISSRNLAAVLPHLNCSRLRLANLLDVPSKDQAQLGATEVSHQAISRSRDLMSEAISYADEILFAWGSSWPSGPNRTVLREQEAWLCQHLDQLGIRRVWLVASQPRHPSRWRQYVGPEKRRVTGATFEERIASVLAAHSLQEI